MRGRSAYRFKDRVRIEYAHDPKGMATIKGVRGWKMIKEDGERYWLLPLTDECLDRLDAADFYLTDELIAEGVAGRGRRAHG